MKRRSSSSNNSGNNSSNIDDLPETGADRIERVTSAEKLIFILSALLVSSIPLYVYQKIFFVPLETFALLFLAVTLVSTFLLYTSYNMHAAAKVDAVGGQIRTLVQEGKASLDGIEGFVSASRVRLEATLFSLFALNSLFVVSYMFVGFYALARANEAVNYAVAVPAAALVTFAFAYDARSRA
eukprot:ANDGO_07028.mRNA.1 hypothetical protein SAMD00019534_014860